MIGRHVSIGWGEGRRKVAPNRNGGRHRCQPPSAPSLDLPVFASQTTRRPSATRSWLTSSGVASSSWSYPRVGSWNLLRPFLGRHLRVACSPGGSRKLPEVLPTLPAPLPVVRLEPKLSSSPSGGDRSFRHLPHLLAVAGFPGRRELPSRSQLEPAKLFRVGKAKNASHCLWITGISRISRRIVPGLHPMWRIAAAKSGRAAPCKALMRLHPG